MLDGLGTFLAGLGGLIVGLVAVASLITAHRARKEAAEAKRTSPTAVLEGLRVQVQAVVDAHTDAVRRHQLERDGLEKALRRERERADGAELVGVELHAQLAQVRIDLASARSEVAELRARFEASLVHQGGTP